MIKYKEDGSLVPTYENYCVYFRYKLATMRALHEMGEDLDKDVIELVMKEVYSALKETEEFPNG